MCNIRLISAILLVLLVPSQSWAALTFFWRAEGTTLSGCVGGGGGCTDDYTAGTDTTAGTTGSPAINATAAMVGSNGIQIDAAAEGYTFDSEAASFDPSAGAIGFWVHVPTSFAHGALIVFLRSNTGANNDHVNCSLSTTTNNHVACRIRNSSTGSIDLNSTYAMSTATSYFVIFKWDNAANDRRIEVYNSSGTLLQGDEDLTTSWTSPIESYPITNGLQFGELSGTTTGHYLDNIFIASTWADGATIACNYNITSYTSYAACGGGGGQKIFWGD